MLTMYILYIYIYKRNYLIASLYIYTHTYICTLYREKVHNSPSPLPSCLLFSVYIKGRARVLFRVKVIQSLSPVWLSATPWTTACRAPLFSTVSQSLPKFMSIELVMPSNHLILCCPLLVLPSIFPSIRVFSNESALHIAWPKYWSFSISPSNEYSGLVAFRIYRLDLLAV